MVIVGPQRCLSAFSVADNVGHQEAEPRDADAGTGAAKALAQPTPATDSSSLAAGGGGGGAGGAAEAPLLPLELGASAEQRRGEAVDAAMEAQAAAGARESNPFRSLGDAKEFWKSVVAAGDAGEEHDPGGATDETMLEGDGGQEVVFTKESESNGQENGGPQALGAATQEQVDAQVGMHGEREEDVVGGDSRDLTKAEDTEMESDCEFEGEGGLQHGAAVMAGSRAGDDQGGRGGDESAAEGDDDMKESAEDREGLEGGGDGCVVRGQDGNDGSEGEIVKELGKTPGALPPPRPLALEEGQKESHVERGLRLHQRCTQLTAGLTGELVEQLRLVLEPTAASRLTGDYKSGKRLNMKRVIAYIASGFRQDRIWMRRTKPDQRQYQLVLAIDETRSMQVRAVTLHCVSFLLCRVNS
jgi:midasin